MLVSLLWASRRLYGGNTSNEKYLLAKLQVPTRSMNKAFTILAANVQPSD